MKKLLLVLALLWGMSAHAQEELSSGQVLYLPIYSHIWHGDLVVQNKYPLQTPVSALVSIRNTSLKTAIRLVSARYYSTDGKLLREYVGKPISIGPMGTYELFVERKESQGGSGANFVLQWDAPVQTNPPRVEALHAQIMGHQTFTFITAGIPIQPEK